MPDRKRQLSRISERLLSGLADLRDTERRKRQAPISSPEFHRLAQEVTEKARQVWRTAGNQEAIGDETERSGDSIDDVATREDPGRTTTRAEAGTVRGKPTPNTPDVKDDGPEALGPADAP